MTDWYILRALFLFVYILLVVFTCDDGAGYRSANLPLRGRKGTVWEGGVRVPAFLSGPPLAQHSSLPPGHTSTALTHITDWFPTILRLAGHNISGIETDGVDLWPAVTQGYN